MKKRIRSLLSCIGRVFLIRSRSFLMTGNFSAIDLHRSMRIPDKSFARPGLEPEVETEMVRSPSRLKDIICMFPLLPSLATQTHVPVSAMPHSASFVEGSFVAAMRKWAPSKSSFLMTVCFQKSSPFSWSRCISSDASGLMTVIAAPSFMKMDSLRSAILPPPAMITFFPVTSSISGSKLITSPIERTGKGFVRTLHECFPYEMVVSEILPELEMGISTLLDFRLDVFHQ